MVLVNSAGPQQSDAELEEKGVYDSSHKKRVPSWYSIPKREKIKQLQLITDYRCDRILWKTTIVVPPDAEDIESPDFQPRPRSRVGQFFVNAFRPPSARATQDNNTPWSPDSGNKTSTDRFPPTPLDRSIPPTAMNYHPSRKFGIIIVLS